jgi:hypothetical protein
MLLVDDLLCAPFKGLLWVFNEIHRVAQEEQANEVQNITQQLSELYMMLDTGQITETEFDSREKQLLDRLERVQESHKP